MAPNRKYTCLLCDTEKWSCRRAAKELIGETVKTAVYLDTNHRSYSAVRERVRTLIQANRRIKASDRFCMPCADHHMAGMRRKAVVPEKTVGGACKECKEDNAEHVLKGGMCPKCWETHQRTCLRNECAEDGVTCEECHATECGGEAWYKGSEDGTYLCRKCYYEKGKAEHRALGTKCAECGRNECGGSYWYKGSDEGTRICTACYQRTWYAEKSGATYTPRGTLLTRMTTPCELCDAEETSRWYSGPRAGTRICQACYCKKCREKKKRSAPASKSAPRKPSKKRKATAAGAGIHAQGVVRKIINKTNAAAFSLAGCSTRGGSAAA